MGRSSTARADRDQVTAALRADMLSTTVAGVFDGFSVSAFAQNVSLAAMTGIKSRFVMTAIGVILVLLGLFPILGAIVAVMQLRCLAEPAWRLLAPWRRAASVP